MINISVSLDHTNLTKMDHDKCRSYKMKEMTYLDKNGSIKTRIITERCKCPGFVPERFESQTKGPCLWCGHDYRIH